MRAGEGNDTMSGRASHRQLAPAARIALATAFALSAGIPLAPAAAAVTWTESAKQCGGDYHILVEGGLVSAEIGCTDLASGAPGARVRVTLEGPSARTVYDGPPARTIELRFATPSATGAYALRVETWVPVSDPAWPEYDGFHSVALTGSFRVGGGVPAAPVATPFPAPPASPLPTGPTSPPAATPAPDENRDTTAPRVTSMSPAARATRTSRRPTIRIRLSEPVFGLSASDVRIVDARTGRRIAASVRFGDTWRRTIVVTPRTCSASSPTCTR